MSTPPEQYVNAKDSLVALRKKIFEELVSGRVKALLDANHDTLNKYGDVVDRLSVVPYMFSNVKQKALALKLNNVDVGVGEVAQAKTDFVIDKATYPITSPANVTERKLPKVDVFLYSPPSNVEIIETTSEKVWSNLFLLQSDKHFFVDSADTENVFFDFYKLRPIGRYKVEITLSSPKTGFVDWIKLTGEATSLVRDLVKVGESVPDLYEIFVLVDANYYSSDDTVGVVPLVLIITTADAGYEPCIIVGGGKRLKSTEKGIFAGWVTEGQFNGWTKTHDAYTMDIKEVLWANLSKLAISVNDVTMGNTSPEPNVYDKKATDEQLVTALPKPNFLVKNWELDDVQYPSTSTFTVKCYRDHTLVCVFKSGVIATVRPNEMVQAMLTAYGASPNYNCVDDVTSDGDTTYVYPKIGQVGCCNDLYSLPSAGLPPTAIIDYVDVWFRVRSEVEAGKAVARSIIKTHNVEYMSEQVKPTLSWELHSVRYATNPFTHSIWASAEIDDLQVGIMCCISGSQGLNWIRTRCTQLWVEVVYHVP